MEVPGLLSLFLILQIFTRITSATVVTSCASCHGDAICLESGETRNTFTKPELSCVCSEGFVGDGLTCYNTKLCSDSSCCGKGYHWSPERGCVDTDECSLRESPCAPHQLCHNTQGSFECLTTSSHFSSDASPMSTGVRFSCGDDFCLSGEDCLEHTDDTMAGCVDPCKNYTLLHDNWRSTNNTAQDPLYCDRSFNGQEWYRLLLNNASARIPEYSVPENRCGTHAPMWLTGPHPTNSGVIVARTVGNTWKGESYYFEIINIHVKLCDGDYYVYKLVQSPTCNLAYCTEPMPPDSTPAPPPDILPPVQYIHLICGLDKIQIGVNETAMNSEGFNAASGNLALYYCDSYTRINDIVWYEVKTEEGDCGNVLEINSTHIMYNNSLFIYPYSSDPFNLPKALPFSCAYPLNTNASLDVALRPFLDMNGSISGTGDKAKAIMKLYKDESYNDTYPSGLVTLPVGSPLYVGVNVEGTPSLAAVLENCHATYTSNPEDTGYDLIENQCPDDDKLVSVTQSGTSLQARFTALFFLHVHDYREVYLHCSLRLCSSSCEPKCVARPKRDVSNSELLEPVTIGPIIWGKTPE